MDGDEGRGSDNALSPQVPSAINDRLCRGSGAGGRDDKSASVLSIAGMKRFVFGLMLFSGASPLQADRVLSNRTRGLSATPRPSLRGSPSRFLSETCR